MLKRIVPLLAALALGALFLPTRRISAQSLGGPPAIDATKLLLANSAMTGGDPSATEELPGLGRKFELYYAMHDDVDPQNPTNEDVSVSTTTQYPAGIGVAVRKLNPGIKIATLTNELSLKYYFPASTRTCSGGSPRIQLLIDKGDGTGTANLFGYVGHGGFGTGCVSGAWDYVDMTDTVPFRWDATQVGLGYHDWQSLVTAVTAAYPNHEILSAALVDDSGSFSPAAVGLAHYDLVTFDNRSLQNHEDTVHP